MSALLVVWVIANLATGAAYVAIPIELARWRSSLSHNGGRAVVWLFAAFILLCGLHHLTMPFLGHASHFYMIPLEYQIAQVVIDSAMAIVSVATHYAILHNRARIRDFLGRLE